MRYEIVEDAAVVVENVEVAVTASVPREARVEVAVNAPARDVPKSVVDAS